MASPITDEEKPPLSDEKQQPFDTASEEVASPSDNNKPKGFLATLRHYEAALDRFLGVEAHAISRKRAEDRDPAFRKWHNQAVMFLLWMSSTLNLSCFTTGFLGWEFGLDLRRSILLIVFGTFCGASVTGWCATMGPGTGLRQVSISRYGLGWWPAKLIAALNVVEQVGWSSVGCITGGAALSAVSGGRVGSELGVIIAAVLGFVISFIGLRAVFQYEKFAGLVLAVVFVVMYGETARFADYKTQTQLEGATLSGTALTLFAVVYGSSASWCSIVADYYVEYPVNTSKFKVWILTTMGICLPTCFGMCLGAIVASALNNNEAWAAVYEAGGTANLIRTILHPYGFANFLLVLLALSGIAMNGVALYSAGLSIQQFARPLAVVPRFVWTSLMFVAVILLALVGRDKLLTFLQNFLSL